MADFSLAIPVVLQHEGKEGTLRADPGGFTRYGWSTAECVQLGISLPASAAEAMTLYQKYFWNSLYNQIISQNVATKILDDCVNQGTPTGIGNLQKALIKTGASLAVDRNFGPVTLAAVNAVAEETLLFQMRLQQYATYDAWIKQNPVRASYQSGLASRAAWPDPDGTIAKALIAGTYTADFETSIA
jgi:lysozyme family protein